MRVTPHHLLVSVALLLAGPLGCASAPPPIDVELPETAPMRHPTPDPERESYAVSWGGFVRGAAHRGEPPVWHLEAHDGQDTGWTMTVRPGVLGPSLEVGEHVSLHHAGRDFPWAPDEAVTRLVAPDGSFHLWIARNVTRLPAGWSARLSEPTGESCDDCGCWTEHDLLLTTPDGDETRLSPGEPRQVTPEVLAYAGPIRTTLRETSTCHDWFVDTASVALTRSGRPE